MQNLIKINIDAILSQNIRQYPGNILKNLVHALNKDKIVILWGIKNVWKCGFIKFLLEKTLTKNDFFYFNANLDALKYIKNNKDLESLLNLYIQNHSKPKIIILENTTTIEGIKNFISFVYQQWYKIVLLWNNIKIEGIKDFELLPNDFYQFLSQYTISENNNYLYYLNLYLQYGSFEVITSTHNLLQKQKMISYLTSDIFLQEIFSHFSVKSIDSYYYTLSFLSKNNFFLSLRELQKLLDAHKSISLKTTMDYIDFSLQAKIIKKVPLFDLKLNKEITTQSKFFFTDLWMRNGLSNFMLEKNTLLENFIFNELFILGYDIYGGLNGKFEFTFIAEDREKKEKIYVHLSKASLKDELVKEVNKLLKIWDGVKKYLIVQDKGVFRMKEWGVESVEIVTVEEFLERTKK